MSGTKLIIVTGPPASGKTTFAERLSKEFCVPLVAKDAIKEELFDAFENAHCADQNNVIAGSAWKLLHSFSNKLLASKTDHILEANFHNSQANEELFEEKRKKYACSILQFHLFASPDSLFKRFKQRWEEGDRHPGHKDDNIIRGISQDYTLREKYIIDVKSELIEIDTEKFEDVDYKTIFKQTKDFLEA